MDEKSMEHPAGCTCPMCGGGKTYVCQSCGSESKGTPGMCCGAERGEKCSDCGTPKKTCGCV